METAVKERVPSAFATTVALPVEPSANLPSVPGALEIQTTETVHAIRPKHVTDERDRGIRADAERIAKAILANPSDIEITSIIYGLGAGAEAANTSNLALADAKIGPLMREISSESLLGKSLVEIKANLDLVNPHIVGQTEVDFPTSVTKSRFMGFGKRVVVEIVKRLPMGNTEVMTLINSRSDTVRSTVNGLKGHLWTERDKALRNAVELAQIANRLADTQGDLQEAVYQGQLVWEVLGPHLTTETDPIRKQSLTYLVNDLAVKVVDLQTVDQLNIQSRMGSETLINNCRGIQTLVGRVTNVLLPAVETQLLVKAGAAQQAQLAASARGIGSAAGGTIAATAAQIGQTSVAIAKMNAEGMIDVEKLEEACASYEQMQIELDEVVTAAEQNARVVSNRLSKLNDRMRDRADPLTRARRAKEAAGV